jgi:hypothetical protein
VTNRYHEQAHAGNLRRMPQSRAASSVVAVPAAAGRLPGANGVGPVLGLGAPDASELELLGRLLLVAVLGGAVGVERELHDQPAGLRTHTLLTIGACLFTMISAYGFGSADPSRLAAQIVTGIGLLGGGAIVRHGLTVKGLTTRVGQRVDAVVQGVVVGQGDAVHPQQDQQLDRSGWGVEEERLAGSVPAPSPLGDAAFKVQHDQVGLPRASRTSGATRAGGGVVARVRATLRPNMVSPASATVMVMAHLGLLGAVRHVLRPVGRTGPG